jgi:uncharacterized RDD family membrane protein YckC
MYCSRCGTWVPAEEEACARCGMERGAETPSAPAREARMHEARTAAPAPVAAAAGLRYAGFWRRFAASFVDGLILFFPNAILRTLAGLPGPFSLHPLQDDQLGRALTMTATLTLIYWWYCARLESSHWQGTLGQQLLGLRVTDLAGRRISFARATGRYFAQWLSLLLCGLGYLFNLWTSRRQTLHDLVAGCVFVRPRETVAPAPEPPGPTYAEQSP